MIVVTGGAGFIGSCFVAKLNELGRGDIILVDRWDEAGQKKKNLAGKRYERFIDKADFLKAMKNNEQLGAVTHVIHMGACSSTTGTDRDYYLRNNFDYSCEVARWATTKRIRMIYASSAATYGNGENGYSDEPDMVRRCRPLNYYGESKQLFDEWVLDNGFYDKIAGLKFFNVFGPNEYHKGDMKSVIAKAYDKVAREGVIMLFRSHRDGYADGEQKRDFIYVKDVVDVMLFLMDRPSINGIYNLGTGEARSWNDLARALFSAVGRPARIEYFDMPEHLRSRYQYFTQAEMGRLRAAGYCRSFTSLEAAVKDYARYLKQKLYW